MILSFKDQLSHSAQVFKGQATDLKRIMWWRNLKVWSLNFFLINVFKKKKIREMEIFFLSKSEKN